jgi:ABC-type hemin transport system ATPase subunit
VGRVGLQRRLVVVEPGSGLDLAHQLELCG